MELFQTLEKKSQDSVTLISVLKGQKPLDALF